MVFRCFLDLLVYFNLFTDKDQENKHNNFHPNLNLFVGNIVTFKSVKQQSTSQTGGNTSKPEIAIECAKDSTQPSKAQRGKAKE